MKNKTLKLFLLLLLVLTLLKTSNAGDRMVYIEFFTSSTCGPCASNNPTMTAFVTAQDIERLVAMGHHMSWPAPGNDPMYLYNTTDNDARKNYYGVNSIPAGYVDGILSIPLPYSQSTLQSYFDQRKNILSPVTIILTDSVYATDSVLVRALVYCETYLANTSAKVYIGIKEDLITYTSAPGSNGEKEFHWVMRKIYPSGNGQTVNLLPGQTVVVEQRFKKDPIWQWSQISPMAFVQAPNKEILNAARKTSNFTLLTNPGYISAPFGQASTKNFKVKVPVVASGYNSPITFTAEVSPVTSGITVSFPNGSTMSNFPDSLNVQVSSTAAVPSGTYQIIVTGTNAASKSHKIALDYLIGKNYVFINTSIPGLEYKVNNVSYNVPNLFTWDLGTSQTLQAVTPQTVDPKRYVFTNWNGTDTNTTKTFTVDANTTSFVANFKTQFKLRAIVASPSGLPVTITNTYSYIDSGASADVTITPTQVQYNGSTYYFDHWTGTGTGAYSGNNPNFTVVMNNPINELAFYTTNIGINNISSEVPDKYNLFQNYPNPFNPETKIRFDIVRQGNVKLKVYDILGKELQVLYSGELKAGKYEFNFNAKDLSSGIYFYKLETGEFTKMLKMLLIK
jgi:hypothetical protein